jgi:hypothetical protein
LFQMKEPPIELQREKEFQLKVTMLNQAPKQDLINPLVNNPLTMETTLTHAPMPSVEDLNSLTLIKVLVNGGKFNSIKNTGLIK